MTAVKMAYEFHARTDPGRVRANNEDAVCVDSQAQVAVLAGCAAVFECEQVSTQTAGDHVLFIGRVHRVSEAPITPLVFQSGHYRMLGEIL